MNESYQLLVNYNLLWLIPGVLIIFYTFFKNKTSISLLALRLLSLLLLVIAISKPVKKTLIANSEIVVAVDYSKSLNADLRSKLEKQLNLITENKSKFKFVAFAEEVSKPQAAITGLNNSGLGELTSFTNLVQNNQSQDILLLSDGFETKGNLLHKLQTLSLQSGKIYPLIVDQDIEVDQIVLNKISVPIISDAGKTETLSIAVHNYTGSTSDGKIIILQNEEVLKEEKLNLAAQQTSLYEFETKELEEGLNTFKIRYQDNNRDAELIIYITAKKQPKILLLSVDRREEAQALKVLKNLKFDVDSFVSSEAPVPNFKPDDYIAVIFNNIALENVPSNAGGLIDRYVKEGGSFMMIGGNKSFGLGGYKNTTYEDILPVKLLKPQKIKKRVNVAVELVLDKSTSMLRSSKMDYTKLATRAVINALKDEDLIGIIGFDAAPFIAFHISQLNPAARLKALRRVDLIFPGGNTNLYPAMDVATSELERARAGRKHMIILTDGILPDAASMGPTYVDAAKTLKAMGVTVSTFLIGPDDSSLLKAIATAGGGKFHRTMDARTLPQLFLDDVKVSIGDRTQRENQQYDIFKKPTKEEITKIKYYPRLLGYVETIPKERANLELVNRSIDKEDPLLAHWKYGKGKAVAYTSDISGRWSKLWLPWAHFKQYWSDVFSFLVTSPDAKQFGDFDLNYYFVGNQLNLDLTIYQEGYSSADFPAEIIWSDTQTTAVIFDENAPGNFQAKIDAKAAGLATLNLTTPDNKKHEFKIDVPDQKQLEVPAGINKSFLYTLASITGGKVNPSKQELVTSNIPEVEYKHYALWFLLFALLSLMGEILMREKTGVL